jgi:hypothetical protein
MKKLLPIFALIFIGFLLFYFGLPVINYGFIRLPLLLLVLVCLGMAFFTKLQFSNQAQIRQRGSCGGKEDCLGQPYQSSIFPLCD